MHLPPRAVRLNRRDDRRVTHMALRFLVVEGNTRGARQAHRDAYGLTLSESYSEVIQGIAQDAVCDIAFPTDEGANLPDAAGLESYDGIVLTGSHLNIYDRTPEILRQIDLMRAIYASRTPSFGSCWGLRSRPTATCGRTRSAGRSASPAGSPPRRRAGRIRCSMAARPLTTRPPSIWTW
jgi:GMP synthase (glutamine-hydrolysing)